MGETPAIIIKLTEIPHEPANMLASPRLMAPTQKEEPKGDKG